MAITFPRDFPAVCRIVGEVPFWLTYQQARGLTGSGTPQVADLGPSLWRGSWRLQFNSAAEMGVWFAWSSSLRGGLRAFKGRPRRRWPISRPKGFAGLTVLGGAAFSGSGTVSAIGAGRDTMTVAGLPVGLILSPGDNLSLPVGTKQHLHRITEGATATAGGLAAVSIEPPLHALAAVNAPVLLEAPWCDMILVKEPSEAAALAAGSLSFEGQQVLF